MDLAKSFPVIRDEFGTRPALRQSKGEFGETQFDGTDPRTSDSVHLSVGTGEWGETEIRGTIGGKRVEVRFGTDEFGRPEISGTGAERYKRLTKPQRDPSTDWM